MKLLHFIITTAIALTACLPAKADDSQRIDDPDSPDFVTATLLIASPGEAIYQVTGHAMLLMECPSASLRYVFSFETDSGGSMCGQLFRISESRLAAAEPDAYLAEFKDAGRGVTGLRLNLTPMQKRELWRELDRIMVSSPDKFNIRTRHCASLLLQCINAALYPSRITICGSDLAQWSNAAIANSVAAPSNRWRSLVIRIAMGNENDRRSTLPNISLPLVIAEHYTHYCIESPDGATTPLFTGTPMVIVPQRLLPPTAPVSPLGAAAIITLLCLTASLLQIIRKYHRVVICIDIVLLAFVTIGGILLIIVESVPASIGTFFNWNFVIFSPLPAIVLLLTHKNRQARQISLLCFGIILLLFATIVPHITLSVDRAVAITAAAIGIRCLCGSKMIFH